MIFRNFVLLFIYAENPFVKPWLQSVRLVWTSWDLGALGPVFLMLEGSSQDSERLQELLLCFFVFFDG